MTTEVSVSAPVTRHTTTMLLPSAAALREKLPLSSSLAHAVAKQRHAIRRILAGDDPRMLVVVGPCSLHDERSAIEYAQRLASLSEQVSDQLLLVMRAYIEKPRTTVGWKGMLYDPYLDGSDDMVTGLSVCRALMIELLQQGVPLATELLHPMATSYVSDLLAWAAIGARTTESQIHREMVSGLPMPVGFKNGTDGSIGVACDAIKAASKPHHYLGVDDDGYPAMMQSEGNSATHLVLRGGRSGPNFEADSVQEARNALSHAGLQPSIMVDCSHGNSNKNPARQPLVYGDVIRQRIEGDTSLRCVMLESHLEEGAQPLGGALRYGVSVTDGCIGWDQTEHLLRESAEHLRAAL